MRINEKIIAKEVRLISAEGEQVGVVPPSEALKLAQGQGLDLVEIAPTATPPVCKIMDYGKYMFQQKKKTHDAKKKQKIFHVKEIKLRPKTEKHDLEFKTKHVERFLKSGDKAKIIIMFHGRELSYTHMGKEILERIAESLKDISIVEQAPKIEGSNMTMILSPKQ